MARVLVTGGAGVIGRALIDLLVGRGDEVRAIDVQPVPDRLPPSVDYVQADIRDMDRSAVSSWGPTVVYHLAATFERSVEEPGFWHHNAEHNIRLSHTLLRAVEGSPSVRRVVFASSYLVYDQSLYLVPEPPLRPRPLSEHDQHDPRNLCGVAKLLHERELESASVLSGDRFSAVSARIFRVYGRGSRDVVSRWVRAALAGERLSLYGPESFFDYVLADDVAEGLLRLAESDLVGPVNLGTGVSRRVSDLVEVVRRAVPGIVVDREPLGPSTYERSQADIGLLRAATGWAPPTTLEEGVRLLVDHEREAAAQKSLHRRVRTAPHIGVLVTSASRKVPLLDAFRTAFLGLNVDGTVWAGDCDARVAAARAADRFWEMPHLGDLDPGAVRRFCEANGIDLVVPTRDGELAWWAEAAPELSRAGIRVAVSPSPCVEACDDKVAFAEVCAAAGLAGVPTFTELRPLEGGLVAVKERRGAGSARVGLRLDEAAAAHHARFLDEPVYQPFIDGDEYTVDLYIAESGQPVGAVVRRRDVVWGGESQVSTVVSVPELESMCLSLASVLGIRAHAVVQAIHADGVFWLIECNPRIGGASALAFAAGLPSPQFLVQEVIGEEAPRAQVRHRGARLLRRPSDAIVFPDQ